MAKEIKPGRVLINLQTGQQITAKGGKHTQRLIVKRGNITPPRIWAWDYEDVPYQLHKWQPQPSALPTLSYLRKRKRLHV